MTGYDVHTDKALKELRARLEVALRERDEANERHAALAEHVVACLPYEAETDGEALDAWECADAASREIARLQRERDEARAALTRTQECALRGDAKLSEQAKHLASEPARIAAAVEARDVAWVRACGTILVAGAHVIRRALGLGDDGALALWALRRDATDEQIATAIRAARGQA